MSIVQETERYVTGLLTEKLSGDHRYHNLPHSLKVKKVSFELGTALGLKEEELEILQLASLLHDTGFTTTYEGHEAVSHQIARKFLSKKNYPQEKLERVLECIDVTFPPKHPINIMEKVIKDADLSNLGDEHYLDTLDNLRHEWEVFLNRNYSDEEWYRLNRKFLKQHQYFTDIAQVKYGPNLKSNRKQLKKMEQQVSNTPVKKNKKNIKAITKIATSKSAQMMFKTALRNHLDLSNLADNKANIMLSVNALIITIAMPVAGSYVSDMNYLLAPMITLLGTCLGSMIFATLATRPIKMHGYTPETQIKNGESNLFFFGNFYKMSFKEYEIGMQEVVSNENILESSIMRDLYFLGRSLGKKYHQLRVCYTIFMVGVVITVMIFAVSYALTPS